MKTLVKCYLKRALSVNDPHIFALVQNEQTLLVGEYAQIKPFLQEDDLIEVSYQNALLPYGRFLNENVRIEQGAIIRDGVTLKNGAIVLMNATINVGASIGENTMIDMNVVIGSKAIIGANCHIGAGSILAGTMEPATTIPVTIEDDVFIGAGSVILNGIKVAKGAIIGAGSVVCDDVGEDCLVYGNPARLIRKIDPILRSKLQLNPALRCLTPHSDNNILRASNH